MGARLERLRALLMPAAVGLLALLLAVLGTLQYRWLEQMSAAERGRLRAGARRHAEDFARDFDRQLAQAWAWLLVTSDTLRDRNFERYAQRREQWRSLARHPELVKGVYLVERGRDGPSLSRFDAERRDFVAEPWPAAFAAIRERVQPLLATRDQETPLLRGPPDPVDEAAMAFVVPIPEPRPPQPPGQPESAARRERRRQLAAFEIIAFDAAAIRDQVLPAMIQRHFEDHDSAFSITVFHASSGQRIAGDASLTRQEPSEASAGLFALRFEQAGGDLDLASGRSASEAARRAPPRRPRPPFQEEGGRWRAVVRHREGPIDAVVAKAHQRNLAVGFSILGLLGASAVLLMLSAQRSRKLAEQQLAFVASVSHELRTPVAVIATSARNLKDGVVSEPEQVKRYGDVIHKEARRLAETVSQVLEFATPRPARSEPVDLPELAREAIHALTPEAQAAGVSIALQAEPGATVLGDASSLRSALLNLISNAIKYGRGSDVRVSLRREDDSLLLSVEDQGLGIPDSERERIFEPFYRGGEATAAQIRGNGLGLSLVRRIAAAHGGSVTVESIHGKGSRFALRLRAPAAGAAERAPHPEPGVPETNPSH
jgi:signal transduction histidine kinase